jgi:hypothetical protein
MGMSAQRKASPILVAWLTSIGRPWWPAQKREFLICALLSMPRMCHQANIITRPQRTWAHDGCDIPHRINVRHNISKTCPNRTEAHLSRRYRSAFPRTHPLEMRRTRIRRHNGTVHHTHGFLPFVTAEITQGRGLRVILRLFAYADELVDS